MDEEVDSGLLAISISDSEDSAAESKTPAGDDAREARTAQSEAEWRCVQEGYRVKVENGEVK
jgi:hypothetical protein